MASIVTGTTRKSASARLVLGDRAALALIVVLTLAARVATFGNPVVGFDEQFYLLVGDRMLHGALPFVDIFDRKPVGLFLIYAGARLLGGEGFLQYKLLAAASVAATAWLLYRTARHRAGPVGAMLAASLYVLWLDFMEAEGGQTPVFYDLLMLGAGALLLASAREPRHVIARGAGALLLVGLALQIKYSVVFEGIFFGCAFLLLVWRQGCSLLRLAGFAALMAALAALPTLAALAYYWSVGHLDAFVFCNFVSIFGQGKGPVTKELLALASLSLLFLPFGLIGVAGRGAPSLDDRTAAPTYLRAWLGAAVAGVLVYWRFNSPHYAIPILLPLLLLLAPMLDKVRRFGTLVAGLALIVGQLVLALIVASKGGNAEARAVAAAAAPRHGCIFVYDSYPALYMLAHSCLPSRWAFPGHLNAMDENNAKALGADPLAITRTILSRQPDAIVDTYPAFDYSNRATHALVEQAIAAHYALSACVLTQRHRVRLVYRLHDDPMPRTLAQCPAAVMDHARALGALAG